jgi:hypothetical protein
VEFTVTRDDLMSLGPDMRFAVEPGGYSAAVGPDSAQVLEVRFEVPQLQCAHTPNPLCDDDQQPSPASQQQER